MRARGDEAASLAPSWLRLTIAAAIGVITSAGVGLLSVAAVAALAGWDATAAIYVAWAWIGTRRMDSVATAKLAGREDPGRAVTDVLLLAASVASLVGIGLVAVAAGSRKGIDRDLAAGLTLTSVLWSWALIHTVFAARYARLYYSETAGGIDFHESELPNHVDFAYVAFTIGMTFQVSDTDLTRKPIRAQVLRHALLSYLFGAVIIAATINLLAGLAR